MSYLRVLRRTVPSFFFLHYCTVRGIAKDPKRCFPFMALVGFDSISGHTFSYYETYCCYCRCQGTHITRSEKHIFCDSSCYCWQVYFVLHHQLQNHSDLFVFFSAECAPPTNILYIFSTLHYASSRMISLSRSFG